MLDFQARAPKRISQTYHHAKYSSAVYLVRLARCVFVYLVLCRVRTGEVPLVDDSPSLSLVNSWPHCNLWTNCFFFIRFSFLQTLYASPILEQLENKINCDTRLQLVFAMLSVECSAQPSFCAPLLKILFLPPSQSCKDCYFVSTCVKGNSVKRREDGTLTTMSTFVKANFVKSHDNELTAIVCEVVTMTMEKIVVK